jgi:hypothetical protein
MPIGPWLPTAARFLPYRRGLFARHLRLMRAGMALAGRIAALRDVEVVPVSATASVAGSQGKRAEREAACAVVDPRRRLCGGVGGHE